MSSNRESMFIATSKFDSEPLTFVSTNSPCLLERLASPILGLILLKNVLKSSLFCLLKGNIVSRLIKKTIYSLFLLFTGTHFSFDNYIHNRLSYYSITSALSVPGLKPTGTCLFRILVSIVDQILCYFTLKQGKFAQFKHKSQRVVAITSLTRNA